MVRLVRLIRIIKAFRSSKRISDLSVLGSSSMAKTCIGFVPKQASGVKKVFQSSTINKVFPAQRMPSRRSLIGDFMKNSSEPLRGEETSLKKRRFVRPGTESSLNITRFRLENHN